MPEARDTLQTIERNDIPIKDGTHKADVLRLLAQNPNTGYEPKEIAAKTTVPSASVYKVLQRLRERELIEKIADNYLVNEERLSEINEMLIISTQFDVAEDISTHNTAPDDVEAVSSEELDTPSTDLLTE
ncbi:DNA-binding PadR family transcriptional regulator [Halorubrum trapanicum]|uniref:DNA-binding PadR family transcriptional regulator n=1 Tax=Halorubrum trapanicum TaxID=29284 RepID=A0A8J7RRR3_9EURY|nr:helix-turn-helix domain-containing protein [Halorubrum trapanicum]MBP1902172.1 DNA-binding PadR family transcriptional regulator [Halorubrum trapanicum]